MCAITTRAKYQSPPRLLDSTRNSNSKRYENVWVSPCFLKRSLFSKRLYNFLSCMCSESVWLTFTCSFSLSCFPSTDHRSAERHSSRAAGVGKRVGQSQEKILRLWAGRPRCTREGWHRGQVSSPRLCVRVCDYMCVLEVMSVKPTTKKSRAKQMVPDVWWKNIKTTVGRACVYV